MKIHELLNHTSHRPWEMPKASWKYYQEWNNAIFLHWPIPLEQLQPHVPKELEIDLFNDQAWVSIVCFTMEKIRPKYLPAFAPISNFDEINIRTYVKYKGKTGVYFLSMEGGKRISCAVAKALSELPYRYSYMKRTSDSYDSENLKQQDELSINYKPLKPVLSKTELDLWLTERYALFQDTSTRINEFEIHHLPWPIQNIVLNSSKVSYSNFPNWFSKPPSLSHYSSGVQVVAWDKIQHKREHT